MQDDLIFIFNVGVGLVPTLSAFRGQPQGIAPTISSQSHATPGFLLLFVEILALNSSPTNLKVLIYIAVSFFP